VLRRWAQILLGEGKDSKAFSPAEEERLKSQAFEMQTGFHDGYITPKDLRGIAAMSETNSEKVLSSTMLQKWEQDGIIERVSRGRYRFIEKKTPTNPNEFLGLLERLRSL
jgi:predicted transcriptional regulator of viral defense system